MATPRKTMAKIVLSNITPPTPPMPGISNSVRVVPAKGGTPDTTGTLALLEAYSDDDGFHCPRCGVTIKNANYAVEHLAKEINDSFGNLATVLKPADSITDRGIKQ